MCAAGTALLLAGNAKRQQQLCQGYERVCRTALPPPEMSAGGSARSTARAPSRFPGEEEAERDSALSAVFHLERNVND